MAPSSRVLRGHIVTLSAGLKMIDVEILIVNGKCALRPRARLGRPLGVAKSPALLSAQRVLFLYGGVGNVFRQILQNRVNTFDD
jgi:hypothetical protein